MKTFGFEVLNNVERILNVGKVQHKRGLMHVGFSLDAWTRIATQMS